MSKVLTTSESLQLRNREQLEMGDSEWTYDTSDTAEKKETPAPASTQPEEQPVRSPPPNYHSH